jgi:hypothetical protein
LDFHQQFPIDQLQLLRSHPTGAAIRLLKRFQKQSSVLDRRMPLRTVTEAHCHRIGIGSCRLGIASDRFDIGSMSVSRAAIATIC